MAELISYITAGYPDEKRCVRIAREMAEAGSDVIELGIPFSDPIADGPSIQEACSTAIKNGMTPKKALAIASEIAKSGKRVMLLSYYNSIYSFGLEKFVKLAKRNGVWAIAIADLPVEESEKFVCACNGNRIKTVFFVAPNTPAERIKDIEKHTTGFLYMLALFGVTGTRSEISQMTIDALSRVKKIVKKPVYVGFGISKPEHVRALAIAGADGIIIGSAYIEAIKNTPAKAVFGKIRKMVIDFKQATL
ncbi:MAG: tryptophan synthase subunit alpha [Candidatus Micrarchaeia archaeon]